MSKRTIQRVAQQALAQDGKMRSQTSDSFQNFAAKLGLGTSNVMSGSSYGFNPITRNRIQLEWMYRGSWIGGVAVDLVADDMTRAGIDLKGEIDPQDAKEIEEAATELGLWSSINDVVKWSRLYGGGIAVMLIDGQNEATPLRLETIGKGQFKGLMVFDRWMVEPSLNDLVTDKGPDFGLPKFYYVRPDAPALPKMKIHYSRCLRLEGIRLPYWQRVTENLWGLSVLERLYDRMVAFDSATTGAAQLVYKSYLRTLKIKDLRQVVAAGGPALDGLLKQMEMMRVFQGNEGITLIDADDEFSSDQHSAFGGLSDALVQFGQQISGALQIPLVRLFGQSPAGMNSTGESDIRTYYDGILLQQVKTLKVPVTRIYRALASSLGIKLPDGFTIGFRSLWQLDDIQKADIAQKVTQTVTQAYDSGLISQQAALKEMKQSSEGTGVWSNITDEDIEAAESKPPDPSEFGAGSMPGEGEEGGAQSGEGAQGGQGAQGKQGDGPSIEKSEQVQ